MKDINRQIIGLGIVAAMRASFAPAILSHFLSKKPSVHLNNSGLKFIQNPVTSVVTKVFCIPEIIGDKLPTTPSRIGFPQILGRVASGAFAGSVLSIVNKENIIKGMLLGGISALVASYGCYHARKYIDSLPGVKDIYTATAEDAIAIASGIVLMK